MLCGQLEIPDTYAPFLNHPVWTEALDWLRALPPDAVPGIHPLRGEQMSAHVHGYETRRREDCRFESHRRYLDLQLCLGGGECIEWHPLGSLSPMDAYDARKDVVHHHPPEHPAGVLRMSPGTFAIFRPDDGHRPKIADGIHPAVTKVVIKIEAGLFLPVPPNQARMANDPDQ